MVQGIGENEEGGEWGGTQKRHYRVLWNWSKSFSSSAERVKSGGTIQYEKSGDAGHHYGRQMNIFDNISVF